MDREFCKRLKELREGNEMTQAELEIAADLPMTVVSHYEKGTRQPGLQNLKALCRGLDCEPNDLLGA